MGNFDRGSKFLLERHGDAVLRLAGVADVREWRPVQPETIAVGQTPDGLLEARVAGREDWVRFLIEFATYPNDREYSQIFRGVLLNHAAKGEPPEAVVFVLHPKGAKQLPMSMQVKSALGGTAVTVQWRVVELWRIPATELQAVDDPGLIPWLPLTDFSGDPGDLLDDCRHRIERLSPAAEREEMLAATRIFASLRFRDDSLLNRLIWRKAMLDIPYLTELKEELKAEALAEAEAKGKAIGEANALRRFILDGLRKRFGEIPESIRSSIQSAADVEWLSNLALHVLTSESLDEFAAETK